MQPDLKTQALQALAAGVSVIPIDATTKKPPAGFSWKAYQEKAMSPAALEAELGHHEAFAGICGAVSGNLLVFDFDVDGVFEQWASSASDWLGKLLIQQTHSGCYQVWIRSTVPVGPNQKLAWATKADSESGREIAIETRGEGGYAVMAPSPGPSGNRYELIQGSWDKIPVFGEATVNAMLDAARRLCSAPLTRQQHEAMSKPRVAPKVPLKQGEISVIEAWNGRNRVRDLLLSFGYVSGPKNRLHRPGYEPSSQPSAYIDEDKNESFHHSSNDPLNDGHRHDPFDVFRLLKHGGDFKEAVKAAAREMGITSTKNAAGEIVVVEQSSPMDELGQLLENTISGKRRAAPFSLPKLTKVSKALMPSTITVLGGTPGASKTWFLLSQAIHWDKERIPFSIMMLEERRAWHLYRILAVLDGDERIADDEWVRDNPDLARAAKARHSDAITRIGKRIFTCDDGQTYDGLIRWAGEESQSGSRIVAVDPVTMADGATGKIWIDDGKFIAGMKRVHEKHQVSILLVTHPKGGGRPGDDPMDSLAGGQAYKRFTSTILLLRSHKASPRACYVQVGLVVEMMWVFRSVTLAKTRNGKGAGLDIAIEMNEKTMAWRELGVIISEVPKKLLHQMPPLPAR